MFRHCSSLTPLQKLSSRPGVQKKIYDIRFLGDPCRQTLASSSPLSTSLSPERSPRNDFIYRLSKMDCITTYSSSNIFAPLSQPACSAAGTASSLDLCFVFRSYFQPYLICLACSCKRKNSAHGRSMCGGQGAYTDTAMIYFLTLGKIERRLRQLCPGS